MELARVGFDRPEGGVELRFQDDVLPDQRTEHRLHLDDDPVQVQELESQHLLAAEGEELAREQGCPVGRLPDLVQVRLQRRALAACSSAKAV